MRTDARINARLGAALAISNLGHSVPDDIAAHPENWMPDAKSEVCQLAGHLMESDLHEEIFSGEAEYWERYARKKGYNKLREQHGFSPWIDTIIEAGKATFHGTGPSS